MSNTQNSNVDLSEVAKFEALAVGGIQKMNSNHCMTLIHYAQITSMNERPDYKVKKSLILAVAVAFYQKQWRNLAPR